MPNSDITNQKEHLVIEDKIQPEDKEIIENQPKPPQNKRWPLALGIILLIAGSGFGWYWWQNNKNANPSAAPANSQANQPRAIPVKMVTVETGIVQESSDFVATLEAPRSVVLKPKIDGRVSQILVKDGDRIQQGQAIVILESEELQAKLMQAKAAQEAAKARLAELQAGSRPEEIAQARAKLAQAQARLNNAQAGARPEEIAQAQSQIDAAKADAELAKERLGRYTQLSQVGAISKDALSAYVSAERSAIARLQEAQRRLSELRKSRGSDITQLAAAVEQEQQNLKQLQNGPRREEIDQATAQLAEAIAQIRVAQVQLQDTKLVAPFAGIIGNIPVKVGDYVSKGTDLTTVTKNDLLELNLSIPLSRASDLRMGLPVQILDAEGKQLATAKVSFISPNVNANSQSVLVKAAFPNNNGDLLNRQFVQARMIWDSRPGVLIPVTAITRLGGKTFVFVAENNQQPGSETPTMVAKQKPVNLGAIQGNNYQVIDGIQAGEKIIVSGILNLRDGAPIQPISEEAK